MTDDIVLDLPNKARVSTLAITATPTVYNELVQRTICLLFCADSRLTVNNQTPYQILQTIGNMPTSSADSRLSVLADDIRAKLNEEEYCIDSLSISMTTAEDSAGISFNIIPADSAESITEVFFI